MNASFPLDRHGVRLQFERRAGKFAAHDAVLREIESRMLERLDLMRIEVARAIDLGCGPGRSLAALARHFPRAFVVGVDVAHAPLLGARGEVGALAAVRRLLASVRPSHSAPALVEADFSALPFADASFDVAWSNCALHFDPEPHRTLASWARLVRPGGLVLFSCFGPDTLAELREHWPGDRRASFIPFVDMHDIGDMLVEAGFTAPVIEMENLTLTYPDADALLAELHALTGNPRADRPRALAGRSHRQAVIAALEHLRDADGRLAVRLEVVTAHAWRAEPRQQTERLPDGSTATRVPLSGIARKPRA
ncbi:methyltransferase domain-containing protein [soil metagenome]